MDPTTVKRMRIMSGGEEENQPCGSVDRTTQTIEERENDVVEPEMKPPTADEPTVHTRTEHEQQRAVKWAKRFAIKHGPTYQNLKGVLHKYRLETGTVYCKHSTPDSNFHESLMVQEVYEQGPSETVEVWDEREANIKRLQNDQPDAENDYNVDHVICTEYRRICVVDHLHNAGSKALIKWEKFPVPTWEDFNTIDGYAADNFMLRCVLLDFVEHEIREQQGADDFKNNFPHRYLQYEEGRGRGGYVENRRALYKNRLRAMEDFFNSINAQYDQPPVYIEDWTNDKEADGILKELKYSHKRLQIDRSLITTQACGLELQRGRQKPLLIFRDPAKDWCIRAVTEFKKHEFVAEYCSETENEASLFPHACEPNCDLQFIHFDREALPLCRKSLQLAAITAKRGIIRGEELSVDKSGGMSLEQLGDTVFNFITASGCTCGSPVCRFTKQELEAFRSIHALGDSLSNSNGICSPHI